ncbi:MAG TPA: hypothetical protein VGM67_06615 [Gemmatimonadaceae bacterium]
MSISSLTLIDSLRREGAQQQLLSRFIAAGAISPSTARTVAELDTPLDDTWDQMLLQGFIREGPPDHFYTFTKRSSPRERTIKMIVFYLLLAVIPLLAIWFANLMG